MKRKIIKILLRYRKLISDHMKEHDVFKGIQYYDREGILAKTIEKDQKELKDIDMVVQNINDEWEYRVTFVYYGKIKSFFINILQKLEVVDKLITDVRGRRTLLMKIKDFIFKHTGI